MVAITEDGTPTAVTTADTIVGVATTTTNHQPHHPPIPQPTTVDPVKDMAPQASLTTPATLGHLEVRLEVNHGLDQVKEVSLGKIKEVNQEVALSDLKPETREPAIIPTTEIKHSCHKVVLNLFYFLNILNCCGWLYNKGFFADQHHGESDNTGDI